MESSSPNAATSESDSETASSASKKQLTPSQRNALPIIPPDYVPISVAGKGVYGNVFFCIPRSAIKTPSSSQDSSSSTIPLLSKPSESSTETMTRNTSHRASKNLQSQLVAVKIPTPGWPPASRSAASEVQHTLHIHSLLASRPASDLRFRFLELLGYDKAAGPSDCTWLILSAIYPSLTLFHLHGAFTDWSKPRSRPNLSVTPIPRCLTAHIFLQIGSALRFLHQEVGIVHADFHAQNVLVDIRTRAVGGFMELVVIDFGRGVGEIEDEGGKRKLNVEVLCFCRMVHEWKSTAAVRTLVEPTDGEDRRDASWKEFEDVVQTVALGEGGLSLDELWTRFEGVAEAVRKSVTVEEMGRVERMMQKAVEQEVEEVVIDKDLWKVLKGVDEIVQNPDKSCLPPSSSS